MKRIYSIILLLLILSVQGVFAKKYHLYIGTYTDGDSKGIYHYLFDSKTGQLNELDVTEGIKNPSFLKISPNKKYLYSVAEGDSYNGMRGGGVASYSIGKKGKLDKINDALSLGNYPCHVTVSQDNKWIVASNYGSGSLAVYATNEDGGISPIKQLIQHEGHGADPKRQDVPHAHSAQFDKSGKYLFSADLGIDQLLIYKYNNDSALFYPAQQPFVKMKAGAGPRHFAFSRRQNFIYVISELNSTVTVLKKEDGKYKAIQDLSTLPADFKGESYCADIHMSANGKFVYGSNRGHNSITIFSRDKKTGLLSFVGTESVRGDWPRNFAIDPSGRFLLVANQKSSNITVYTIDKETGKLTYTGTDMKLPNPVCLEFKD